MKLSVKERLILLGILPPQGDIASLKIVRKLREDLGFSEKEQKKIKLIIVPGATDQEGGYRWDGEIEKDVEIGEKATDIIVKSLTDLSSKGQLHIDQLDLYEKFVEKEKT